MEIRDFKVLKKIIEEIKYIEETTREIVLFESFIANETIRRAVAMTLINIGELARLLSDELIKSAPDIPFRQIIATRNYAAHGYEKLRFDFIWHTIKTDIPDLKIKIKKLLKK